MQQSLITGRLQDQNATLQGRVDQDNKSKEAANEAAQVKAEQDKELAERIKFRDAMVKAYQSMTASDASELQKQVDLSQKWADSLSKSDDEALKKRQEFAAALEKHQDQIAAINAKNSDALQEDNINRQRQTGQLSPYQAAVQTAQLHTNQYQTDYSRLIAAIQAAKNSGNTGDQDQLEDQLAELQGRRQIESANDQYQIGANSFRAALDEFVNSTNDAAGAMRSLTVNTLDSLNSNLSQALTAHTYNGQEYRRGIVNAFAQTGRGAATSLTNTGLRNLEGGVLGAFDFGGKGKPDGSASNPLFVKSADSIGTAGSKSLPSIGGLFSSLFGGSKSSVSPFSAIDGSADPLGLNAPDGGGFGFLQGFFANGGDVTAGRPAVVGDGGRPELFVPQTAGHIYPDASAVGGSSTTNHVYIDASGSSDPAATEQAVHRAMGQYLPYSVGASVSAVKDYQARRPASAR